MVRKKPVRKKTAGKKTVKKTARKTKEVEPTWDEIGKAIGKRIESSSNHGKFIGEPWGHKNNQRGFFKYAIREKVHSGGTGGCFYFLGFMGSLAYYWTTAPTVWDAFLGFFKAVFWPAFLTYGVLKFIGL